MALNMLLWSTTALTNNNINSPEIRWNEGQPPSQINDSGRAMMAALTMYRKDTSGELATTGSSNAYAVTTNTPYATLVAGQLLGFTASFSNSAASTLDVNGLGAVSIKANGGGALSSGDIVSGKIYWLFYTGTEWRIVTAAGAGSSYTDENAQDAVGTILTDTATIDFTYNDAGNTIIADVKDDSITYAKMQNVSATSRILGRITAAAGDAEELTGSQVRTIAGLAATDTPQFAGIEVGAVSDTTLSRISAGDLSVEGNLLYRANGTDVPVADGGAGRSSATANALLAGGTTSTAAHQSLATGLPGQLLGQASGSALPAWANRGVVIASGSMGTGATLDVTNIPQTYANIGVYFDGVSCDTATREFQIRASNNNGSSFSSTTTDYRGINWTSPSTMAAKARATLTETATQAAAAVRTGSLLIFGYSAFTYPNFLSFSNDGATLWVNQGQLVLTGINALRFQWDASGNFDSGSYIIVGF